MKTTAGGAPTPVQEALAPEGWWRPEEYRAAYDTLAAEVRRLWQRAPLQARAGHPAPHDLLREAADALAYHDKVVGSRHYTDTTKQARDVADAAAWMARILRQLGSCSSHSATAPKDFGEGNL